MAMLRLELVAPLLSNSVFIGGACLVIDDLEADDVAAKIEGLHVAITGCGVVVVVTGPESLNQYHVAVGVIRHHDVVVVAAGSDGEASHIVGVELADRLDDDDEEFIGLLG